MAAAETTTPISISPAERSAPRLGGPHPRPQAVLGITRERLRLGPLAVHPGTAICPCVFQKLEGSESYAGRFADQTEDSFRAARSSPSHRPQPSSRSQVAASRAAFSWPCRCPRAKQPEAISTSARGRVP